MNKITEEIKLLWLKAGVLKELLGFLFTHKLWWAVPIVVIMIFLAVVLLFGQATHVGPFIYPFF